MIEDIAVVNGVVVYCGSSLGSDRRFAEAARQVGREIARRGLPLVYGGGFSGMMGAVSRAAREAGGRTLAVIPQFMVDRGWCDPESSETIVTSDIHERKRLMASMSLGAITLPGGVGTFEELSEIITWRQLGLYDGRVAVVNVGGFYDGFLSQIGTAVSQGFLRRGEEDLFRVVVSGVDAVDFVAGGC